MSDLQKKAELDRAFPGVAWERGLLSTEWHGRVGNKWQFRATVYPSGYTAFSVILEAFGNSVTEAAHSVTDRLRETLATVSNVTETDGGEACPEIDETASVFGNGVPASAVRASSVVAVGTEDVPHPIPARFHACKEAAE